jgi:hypothetical protein
MSAAHTPGPWFITKDSQWNDVARIGRTWVIGSKLALSEFGSPDADARLIAAAPDLLFQLLAAANYIDALGGDSKSYRAAIARATGETA